MSTPLEVVAHIFCGEAKYWLIAYIPRGSQMLAHWPKLIYGKLGDIRAEAALLHGEIGGTPPCRSEFSRRGVAPTCKARWLAPRRHSYWIPAFAGMTKSYLARGGFRYKHLLRAASIVNQFCTPLVTYSANCRRSLTCSFWNTAVSCALTVRSVISSLRAMILLLKPSATIWLISRSRWVSPAIAAWFCAASSAGGDGVWLAALECLRSCSSKCGNAVLEIHTPPSSTIARMRRICSLLKAGPQQPMAPAARAASSSFGDFGTPTSRILSEALTRLRCFRPASPS